MSAIARYYNVKGLNVSGYDKTPSPLTCALESEGIQVHYTDDISYIPGNIEETLVVYTPAIPHDMGELVYVMEKGYSCNYPPSTIVCLSIVLQVPKYQVFTYHY